MKATASAGSNIAFVKYWGVREDKTSLPHPLNASVSMTLRGAGTTTTVAFCPTLKQDTCTINDQEAPVEARNRVSRVLDRVRDLSGVRSFARVASVNHLPTSAGVASSASGFAALALSSARAAGLPCEREDLVPLAILGSGSAGRSLFGGYVLWSPPAAGRPDSHVEQVAGEDHWDLVDLVAIVSVREKVLSSAKGHLTAQTSPLLPGRLASLEERLPRVIRAIRNRDFASLGEHMEEDALSMHAVMMTSRPSLMYWEPATLSVIEHVRWLREHEGMACYFTIDAGPNVHVITEPNLSETISHKLKQVEGVQDVLFCRTGPGVSLTEDPLF